ncbi:endonuclease/exonuclease/phosphatase family protein [Rathayibacter sp. YIM 133350]|uniref:endonuclease/exonuclease/phosphatase family protein n=1 Tax=Rathayibacter sp. YIM 133350 TaxID=3131992 RepID=UPI00307ED6DC
MLNIGTWNLENLFLPGGEFGPSTTQIYERKLDLLAGTIMSADLDVLAVQEVGDPAPFDDLRGRLEGSWTGVLSTHFELGHPIRVGFLSRVAIAATSEVWEIPQQLRNTPTSDDGAPLTVMGRGAVHIELQPGGEALHLVTAHFKSKLLSFPGRTVETSSFTPHDEGERARYGAYALNRRAAEAVTVRGYADTLLDGQGTQRRVIVMGDLNDEVLAATTQILNGPPGSEIGTAGEHHPDKGDAWRLLNLAPLIPEDKRYSRVFEGRRELIDHQFISTALRDKVQSVTTVAAQSSLPSITVNAAARKDDPASDHAMVLARYDL